MFGRPNGPEESVMRATIDQFRTMFILAENAQSQSRHTVCIEETFAHVEQNVKEDTNESIRHRGSTLGKILRKDLGWWVYKFELVQELKPDDHQTHRTFDDWTQEEMTTDLSFHKKVLFSDEVHFWSNGYVNQPYFRIWDDYNPQAIVKMPLHLQKVTAWYALLVTCIIGPYFFKNEAGQNVTFNGECYRAMISDFFVDKLKDDTHYLSKDFKAAFDSTKGA